MLEQSRKCIPFAHVICKQFQVDIPFVTNDFSACKAPDWSNLQTQSLKLTVECSDWLTIMNNTGENWSYPGAACEKLPATIWDHLHGNPGYDESALQETPWGLHFGILNPARIWICNGVIPLPWRTYPVPQISSGVIPFAWRVSTGPP